MPADQNKPLPDFAPLWMAQWKRAAEELSRIRDQELRLMGQKIPSDDFANLDQDLASSTQPTLNGLVVQQQWFMRQRLLESVSKTQS